MDDELQTELFEHINDTPHLLSALWDLGLLPEQLEAGSPQYWFMMGIAFRDKFTDLVSDMSNHI